MQEKSALGEPDDEIVGGVLLFINKFLNSQTERALALRKPRLNICQQCLRPTKNYRVRGYVAHEPGALFPRPVGERISPLQNHPTAVGGHAKDIQVHYCDGRYAR